MIKRSKKEKKFVTLFPDFHGGKHDLMWKRMEGLLPDARAIDKTIISKLSRVVEFFAEKNNISSEEALSWVKQSRTYALIRDSRTGYVYEGDVFLYHKFQDEYEKSRNLDKD